MNLMNLLKGEEIITESDGQIVTLTNYRIRYHSSDTSRAHIVSIMLDKLSSIEVHYSSITIYLALGVIAILTGGLFLVEEETYGVILIGFGIILIGLYFSSRKHMVTICSDGGDRINFQANGMKKQTILDFINKVEKARLEFTIN